MVMIDIYVEDIKRSLENKCYFSALALALTLPDICGMAEYPDEGVSTRYINWYDKYLGDDMSKGHDAMGVDNPWLSGEVVYNLRNTYLHQGSPSIESSKVKEEANQLDQFTLVLGDGTVIEEITTNINFGNGEVVFRSVIVDITFLCNKLCEYALKYYKENAERFKFEFYIMTQEEFLNPTKEKSESDVLAKIINKKLADSGSTKRVKEDPKRNFLKNMMRGLKEIAATEDGIRRFVYKSAGKRREQQVRSFLGRYFKEKLYVRKKEEIIQSVLVAETKYQVKENLKKHFSDNEARDIYQRLQPLIKNMPDGS